MTKRTISRKWRKLRQSPRDFLADSSHPALRMLNGIVDTGWPRKPNQPIKGRGPAKVSAPSAPAKSPTVSAAATARQLIEKSGLFDAKFYLGKYPDVRAKNVKNPLDHYLSYGMAEMRQPNALFDPRYYATSAGIKPTDSPLVHYLREGERKGFLPHPTFDPVFYLANNPDVAGSGVGALSHYLRFGSKEGRQPRQALPTAARINLDTDLQALSITILIPVFNGGEHVRRCIESVLANTNLPRAELLLIDDASTDAATRELLDGYAQWPKVTLLRNEQNLGFTRSVNRGLRYAQGRDVVLLNSDTVVTPRWLEALALVAYGSRSMATATALSDNAGAFSTPGVGTNRTLEFLPVQVTARLSARAGGDEAHLVPTGNGFCMYMRADAIADVGLLDDVNFPRGYGEENDWCMRAVNRGWRHAIALRAYVHHVNAVSFGSEAKEQLRESARATLLRLYPDYEVQVRRAFGGNHSLSRQRASLDGNIEQVRRNTQAPPRPRILFVISTLSGGTPATNSDLMRGMATLFEPLLLVSDSHEIKLFDCSGPTRVELARQRLQQSVSFAPHTSYDYDRVITEWLVRFAVELVHVRHIAWHSLGLVHAARRLCIPTIFSFHDFYTMCPSVNLTNGTDGWSETGVTQPHIQAPLWESAARDAEAVKAIQAGDAEAFLATWKARMNAMLSECSAFVTTSPAVQAILAKNLPVLRERASDFHIVPHGRDFDRFLEPGAGPTSERPLRVVVIGNISRNKGLNTILELMELDAEGKIELHTLGDSPDLARARGTHHGAYRRENLLTQLEAIAADVALIPTICPETFCHTLSESWAAGLPVVGSELGALGERLRDSGGGWTIDPRDTYSLLKLLYRIHEGQEDWQLRAEAVRRWQATIGKNWTVEAMTARYLEIYQDALQQRRPLLPGNGRRGIRARAKARVAVVTKGHFPTSVPTVHVRIATQLDQSTHEKVDYDWLDAAELIARGVRDFDGVIVCRNGHDQPSVLQHLAEQCRRYEVPLVLDLDDDLLNVPTDKDPTQGYLLVRPALMQMLDMASLLTMSTEPLAQTYAGLTRSIRVVPNQLNPRVWLGEPAELEPPKELDRAAKLRVLYMGSPTHHEDLQLILPAFSRLRARYGVQLHTIGVTSARLPQGLVAIPPASSRYDLFIAWFRSMARHFDVAVAPLVDTPFNHCKSNLKFLEYAACGLPVVASRVGPYAPTIRDGQDGLLVDNDEEAWFQAMTRLLDPELRASLGSAARQRAEKEFMATSCVFDTLPWTEWGAGAPVRTQSGDGGNHQRRFDAEPTWGA